MAKKHNDNHNEIPEGDFHGVSLDWAIEQCRKGVIVNQEHDIAIHQDILRTCPWCDYTNDNLLELADHAAEKHPKETTDKNLKRLTNIEVERVRREQKERKNVIFNDGR